MCILIWRGRFWVIDEALYSNQLVIGAQLLNNAFIRPCDVFNGSPLQCKYVWSALMSLLWDQPRENGISLCDIAPQYNLFTLNWQVRRAIHRSSYKLMLLWLFCSAQCSTKSLCSFDSWTCFHCVSATAVLMGLQPISRTLVVGCFGDIKRWLE